MTILFTNNASTSLASGITSGATSLTVATGQGALFPTITGSNIFYLTLQNQAGTTPIEIVKVTARSGDTMTIVRGQDNTTASAFNAGDKVELRLPAVVLQDFPQLDVSNTFTVDQSISGLTVGKGGGAVAGQTAVGQSALASNTSGNTNSAFGYLTLTANTTGVGNNGFGQQSLQANTTGGYNSAYGLYTLIQNTTGSYNTAIGVQSLQANTTASNNTAVGYQAGYSGTTGADNTHYGYKSGYSRTTGAGNTLIGDSSGYSLTTGNANTFVGAGQYSTNGSGYYVTTGSNNTVLGGYDGNQGGLDIRTASGYIVLSDGDGNPRVSIPTGTATATIPNATGTVMVSGNMPAFSAYLTGTQTISANTWTKVILNNKEFDTANAFDSTTNYRFTPLVAGYYQLNIHVSTGLSSSTNFMISAIYKNGNAVKYGASVIGTANGADSTMASLLYLNGSTDYVEMWVYQNTASGNTVTPNGNETNFSGSLVRAA